MLECLQLQHRRSRRSSHSHSWKGRVLAAVSSLLPGGAFCRLAIDFPGLKVALRGDGISGQEACGEGSQYPAGVMTHHTHPSPSALLCRKSSSIQMDFRFPLCSSAANLEHRIGVFRRRPSISYTENVAPLPLFTSSCGH